MTQRTKLPTADGQTIRSTPERWYPPDPALEEKFQVVGKQMQDRATKLRAGGMTDAQIEDDHVVRRLLVQLRDVRRRLDAATC